MPEFVRVANVSDVPVGTAKRVIINAKKIALYNVAGEFYATDDTCSHAEASLSEGSLDGEVVECPKHGACFNVKTGQALSLPAWAPVDTFEVKVEGDTILVAVK